MRRSLAVTLSLAAAGLLVPVAPSTAQTAKQPKVAPGPNEPSWWVILTDKYGLSMFGDLLNPVETTPAATPGLFKKAGPGPVVYRPVIALGLETVNRGGWYAPGADDRSPVKKQLWTYQQKNTTEDLATGKNLPPSLAAGSTTTFDLGEQPFGLWVGNDGPNDSFKPNVVFTQPQLVTANNPRLAKQPYKAMIYPNRDKATGKRIPHSYLIGWEYSTNDDFQDIVCQVDNVELIGADGKEVGTK